MRCFAIALGMVRLQVTDEASVEAMTSLGAAGAKCGGGRGTCEPATRCVTKVPTLGFHLPPVAWCSGKLQCCAELVPSLDLRPEGRDYGELRFKGFMDMTVEELVRDVAAKIDSDPEEVYLLRNGFEMRREMTLEQAGFHQKLEAQFFTINLRMRGGIAFGHPTPWQAIPYVARLEATWEGADEHGVMFTYTSTCSGALVGSYVLTAAHCFRTAPRDAPETWTVYVADPFGVMDAGMPLTVTRITPNPLYSADKDAYDFAVMEVELPWRFVGPAPLLLDSREPRVGTDLFFAGFGKRENELPSGELRTAVIPAISCPVFEQQGLNTVRCAASGTLSPVSTCVGDSGGPVLRFNGYMHVLTAVNSFGYAGDCGDFNKKTGVNMIARNRAFIEEVTHGLVFV